MKLGLPEWEAKKVVRVGGSGWESVEMDQLVLN